MLLNSFNQGGTLRRSISESPQDNLAVKPKIPTKNDKNIYLPKVRHTFADTKKGCR
jgi:hypothetical protein